MDTNDTNIENIGNLDNVIQQQISKLNKLREEARKLEFIPIDPMGSYSSITYKAVDGGKMNISFNPLEIDFIEVADSNGNLKMRFLVPKSMDDNVIDDRSLFENNDTIKNFLKILGKDNLSDISEILSQSDTYMELAEWACLFEKIMDQKDDPMIIMRDGLLRTKKIKAELIPKMIDILKSKSRSVKLVGVSKISKIINLLAMAISIEHKFPSNSIGFIKIPKNLEIQAYKWTGRGKIKSQQNRLNYAFGDLYVAKLSRKSNLLVTVEIPRDLERDEVIYNDQDIIRIMGYLAKDSATSYPVIGYPQTIMRAHEFAARVGFPASIIRDKILDKLKCNMDKDGKDFMDNALVLNEVVNKGVLGGGTNNE
ncbi:DNA double-strand break repair nuclease NurA [Ferroplasma sp.]|uniref:DNA double-strand break repair nuclease NurA n=1 Tax=Ferroplasma sp. TaxID=2591003 RepID=UPI00261B13D1|nr:DNA double-strand break repair nuclease NurA [Ferroplasma sp.]